MVVDDISTNYNFNLIRAESIVRYDSEIDHLSEREIYHVKLVPDKQDLL